MAYGCQLGAGGDCMESIPVVNIITGVLFVSVGLFLCFLAQRFFHIGKLVSIVYLSGVINVCITCRGLHLYISDNFLLLLHVALCCH